MSFRTRSHLKHTRTSRDRSIVSSARRVTGHSSTAHGACGLTPQSGQWAITRWAVNDVPLGQRNRFLKYIQYLGVAFTPPDRNIIGSGMHEYV